jgi:hypothetical protein
MVENFIYLKTSENRKNRETESEKHVGQRRTTMECVVAVGSINPFRFLLSFSFRSTRMNAY